MNVNINNKNLFSQSLLINKFFFQKNSSHKQTGITTVDSGCQYRNNNYYYNKDGVPFLSKEQADRCINGKDWKKIVSVSDKVKSDLEKVVKQDFMNIGNLDSLRDCVYAKDYVECMWLILQQDKPQDFVIATGVQHTVREFATLAFHYAGIELRWEGEGIDEKGIDAKTGKVLVAVSEDFYRPTDVVNLWGDPTKAKNELGWNPQSTSFEELVKIMVSHDMQKVAAEHVANVMRTNLAEYLEKGIVK